MVAALMFTLALLALQPGLKSNGVVESEMTERMKEREVYLNAQMARLLHDIEQRESTDEATLYFALEQWKFLVIPAALVLVFLVYWLGRKMLFASASHNGKESSIKKQETSKEEEDLNGLSKGVMSSFVSTPFPRPGLPNYCKVVRELMDSLLSTCRVLCERSFMPQLRLAPEMSETCETWSIEEKSISYHLLVFLRPPHGHSFHLDPDTTKEPSNIHVVLECMCWKRELLGSSVCFLHHHDSQVPRSFLLDNLCTSSYLNMEKVARWVQLLVTSAWQFLRESHHCQLMVLPSSKTCRFQLTSTAEINIFTEMFFAVEHEN